MHLRRDGTSYYKYIENFFMINKYKSYSNKLRFDTKLLWTTVSSSSTDG